MASIGSAIAKTTTQLQYVRLSASLDFISQSALDIWRQHDANETKGSIPALNAALPALAKANGHYEGKPLRDWLADNLRQTENNNLCHYAAVVLRAVGAAAASPKVLMALVQALTQTEYKGLRQSAAEVLSVMRVAAAIPEALAALMQALTQNEDKELRWSAIEALGEMGATAATSEVLAALVQALVHSGAGAGTDGVYVF